MGMEDPVDQRSVPHNVESPASPVKSTFVNHPARLPHDSVSVSTKSESRSKLRPNRLAVFFPLVYMAGLFGLSSIPGEPTPQDPGVYTVVGWIPPQIQNLLHIPLFGGLAWLWSWSLQTWMKRGWLRYAAAFVLTAASGVFDELYQTTVPGRYGSLTDMGLNALGAVLAIWLCHRSAKGHSKH
jgi:hypothetical protein